MPCKGSLAAASAVALLAGLGGCISLTEDGGMTPVRKIASAELQVDAVRISTAPDAAAVEARVAALLRQPLTPTSAMQVALLNNRGLQAAYNELGIAEAQAVQASLPPSPRFGFNQLVGDLEVEITRQLAANILALATLPARSEIAWDQFRAAQIQAANATLALAADTRRQFYRAVAANERVASLSRAADPDRDTGPPRARAELGVERERLNRQLGLWDDGNYRLPARLPALPRSIRSMREVEAQALDRRLDLQVAKLELAALAKSLGLTQATRFVTDLELAAQNRYKSTRKYTTESGGTVDTSKTKTITNGFVATIEIPLFNFGGARVAEAEQRYLPAANPLAESAVNARSEVREAYHAYRGAYAVARASQNGATSQISAVREVALEFVSLSSEPSSEARDEADAILARRNFWIASATLDASLAVGDTGSSINAPRIR